MTQPSIELEGLKEAQRALRSFGATGPAAKQMNQAIVDELLVPPSKANAPKRSGRLADSIRSDATATYGFILAGYRGPVEYAGIIHFGWSTRGLGRGKLTGTVAQRRTALRNALDADIRANVDRSVLGRRSIDKAARLSLDKTTVIKERDTSTGRFVKGGKTLGTVTRRAVRGGPIKPNPFIYEAIDGRRDAVFREYEEQLEQRARIEALL